MVYGSKEELDGMRICSANGSTRRKPAPT
jgi:hypothetical protein